MQEFAAFRKLYAESSAKNMAAEQKAEAIINGQFVAASEVAKKRPISGAAIPKSKAPVTAPAAAPTPAPKRKQPESSSAGS